MAAAAAAAAWGREHGLDFSRSRPAVRVAKSNRVEASLDACGLGFVPEIVKTIKKKNSFRKTSRAVSAGKEIYLLRFIFLLRLGGNKKWLPPLLEHRGGQDLWVDWEMMLEILFFLPSLPPSPSSSALRQPREKNGHMHFAWVICPHSRSFLRTSSYLFLFFLLTN